MKKVFIDCGAYNGSSVRKFRVLRHDSPDFEIYSFEANPVFYEDIEKTGTKLFRKAVWTSNGKKDFFIVTKDKYGSEDMRTGSSTLNEEKNKFNSVAHKRTEAFTVDTIDISTWITENFSKEDFIILKMDIEGSEYDVLNKMIVDGSIDLIDKLWIEFHHTKCGISQDTHDNLLVKLKNTGIEIDETWDSMGF
tara:strand:+ start:14979 stop:15557 length:579 start_codon:yes stop_codon:yes gene_type:complete